MHGLYCVTHNLPPSERRRAQLDALLVTAANNLDTLYLAYLWLQPHERGHKPAWDDLRWALSLLDQAHKRGVQLVFEDTRDLGADTLARLTAHPALTALGMADDANRYAPAELSALCTPEQAPGTPRYISIGATPQQSNPQCYGHSELIGVQVYPYQFAPTAPARWGQLFGREKWRCAWRISEIG